MRNVIALVAVLAMSVASASVAEAQKSSVKFRDFSSFEVENFENATAGKEEAMPDAWIPTMREDVAQRVIELHKFQRVADFGDSRAAKQTSDRVLVLKGKIVEYTKGSQAVRFLVGMGAGKGKIVAMCQFVDKATGEVVLERKVDGRVIKTGQSTEGAIQGISKELKKVVEQNW